MSWAVEEPTKNMAIRLYGMLVTYIRRRPLQLIRHLKNSNGYLVERDGAESSITRQRSLALLTQVSRVRFSQDKTNTEQLPAYDALVRVRKSLRITDSKIAAIRHCP